MEDFEIDYCEIGKQLHAARKAAAKTQQEVAEAMGFGVSYYSNIERGQSEPNLKRILQLCELLNVKPGEILDQCTPKIRDIQGRDGAEQDKTCAEILNAVFRCSPRSRALILCLANAVAAFDADKGKRY